MVFAYKKENQNYEKHDCRFGSFDTLCCIGL